MEPSSFCLCESTILTWNRRKCNIVTYSGSAVYLGSICFYYTFKDFTHTQLCLLGNSGRRFWCEIRFRKSLSMLTHLEKIYHFYFKWEHVFKARTIG